MAHVPASSHTVFNGGTITAGLRASPSGTEDPIVEVDGNVNSNVLLDLETWAASKLTYDNNGTLFLGHPSDAPALRAHGSLTGTNRIATFSDNTGAEAFSLLYTGHPIIKEHAAPADADLGAGELAWWFDQTNGAAKLMFKGKSANGAVVAASVALA